MPEETRYCRNCGQQLRPQARHCDRCGARQDAVAGQPRRREETPQATDGGITRRQALVGGVGGLALGIGALAVLSGGDDNGPAATVEDYWTAIDEGDLDRAAELTTENVSASQDATASRIAGDVDISVAETTVASETDETSTVEAVVDLAEQGGVTVRITADHALEQRDGWLITDIDVTDESVR